MDQWVLFHQTLSTAPSCLHFEYQEEIHTQRETETKRERQTERDRFILSLSPPLFLFWNSCLHVPVAGITGLVLETESKAA